MDGPREIETINDSIFPKDSSTPSPCAYKPPPFSNQLKGKKMQSYVDSIKETFFQVKISIPLLDVIQPKPVILISLIKTSALLTEPPMFPKGHF